MPDPVIESPPSTWGEVFPWLESIGSQSGERWWDEPVNATPSARRRRNITAITELATSRLSRWTIGQLFPTADSNQSLTNLELPARAINAICRAGYGTVDDLKGLTVENLFDWRNVGSGTVTAILESIVVDAALGPHPTIHNLTNSLKPANEPTLITPNLVTPAAPAFASPFTDDVHLVVTWFSLAGLSDAPFLARQLPVGTPHDVVRAWKRLESMTATSVTGQSEPPDGAALLDRALRDLDHRAISILRDRMFGDSPETLERIGSKLGVTRERVRQIEAKARNTLLAALDISNSSPIALLGEAARRTIGELLPLDLLLSDIPALAHPVDSIDQPAWRVLDRIDDAYEIADGWCASPTIEAARAATGTRLAESTDAYGVTRVDAVDFMDVEDEQLRHQFTARWLESCGYRIDGDFVFTRTQSVQDYAASILSVVGSPMSADEIVSRFAVERSIASLRNVLAIDDRFTKIDRDRWALAEWGIDGYSNIRTVIRQQLAKNGGSVNLETLVDWITSKYSVSPSSVIAYASATPFETVDRIVRITSRTREVRKTPRQTHRMFRWSNEWAIRIAVTKDHLRGSGSVAPIAVATILDLQPGETVQLSSDLGPQSVTWTGIQPHFGTVRRFLLEQDVAIGTEAFLVINDDRTFSVKLVRDLIDDPVSDALALVGAKPHSTADDAYVSLCRAIESAPQSGLASLIDDYRSRGDTEIADLILAGRRWFDSMAVRQPAPAPNSTDVDAILELL
ncbi:sigma factor-like helix-turn-helix DNA-binding protein [Rhodococcus qingshengii]|uniref:sigma factor-like helix-turn-helix DNA-binding protein n=1 Tax=Rhodococcus TaxID=1827 RepID=UPI001BAE9BFA|nr:sigma factor-like helix-turn-helix DNA-binding protein [Rhodococcus qingshengii]MBS3695254.1 hypothetical protein [Rhodococcus qingshengii]